MFKAAIHFIHSIRALLLLLIVLAFFSLTGVNPVSLGYFLGARFGLAIGMNVSVPENPINRLALELKEKQSDLEQREQALLAREQALYGNRDRLVIYGTAVGILLLSILIAVNFYLDLKRRKAKDRP